jgi:2'-5' RNA ligase
MSRVVVDYPRIAAADFEWIQEYRKRNDPRYFQLIDPHFTLVFPVADVPAEHFCRDVRTRASGTELIAFEIKVATINRDLTGSYYHEFLVPDAGYAALVKLHDRLYSGVLAPHLRLDIDFIPHIAIGNTEDPFVAKRNVDALNARGVQITGTIDALDILEYDGGRIRPLDRVVLRARA